MKYSIHCNFCTKKLIEISNVNRVLSVGIAMCDKCNPEDITEFLGWLMSLKNKPTVNWDEV